MLSTIWTSNRQIQQQCFPEKSSSSRLIQFVEGEVARNFTWILSSFPPKRARVAELFTSIQPSCLPLPHFLCNCLSSSSLWARVVVVYGRRTFIRIAKSTMQNIHSLSVSLIVQSSAPDNLLEFFCRPFSYQRPSCQLTHCVLAIPRFLTSTYRNSFFPSTI